MGAFIFHNQVSTLDLVFNHSITQVIFFKILTTTTKINSSTTEKTTPNYDTDFENNCSISLMFTVMHSEP